MSGRRRTGAEPPRKDIGSLGQWDLIRLRFCQHRLAVAALVLLAGLYFIAAFARFFQVNDPGLRNAAMIYAPPAVPSWSVREGLHVHPVVQHSDPITLRRYYTVDDSRFVPLRLWVRGHRHRVLGLFPSSRHFIGVAAAGDVRAEAAWYLMGGDKFGRDVFSRILEGTRISLSIGLAAIAISFVLGVTIGGASGYFGGWVDIGIQRAIEIINAFPKLPLWLALGAALPRTWSNLQVYLGITMILSLMGWTGMARVIRGKILALREEDYAVAARLLGASHGRILFRHLVPGFTSHIIVSLSMTIPGMILGETSLSFLGLGLKAPTVSWGVMLQDCMSMQVVKSYPWLLLPVGAIILTVMCFNFIGDGLRDAADPYGSR